MVMIQNLQAILSRHSRFRYQPVSQDCALGTSTRIPYERFHHALEGKDHYTESEQEHVNGFGEPKG